MSGMKDDNQLTIQLHSGDCLEFMKTMADNSVDLVLVDPPYGTEGTSGYGRGELWAQGNGLHRTIEGDKDISLIAHAHPQHLRVSRGGVIMFSHPKNSHELYRVVDGSFAGQIVWDKKNMGLGGKFRYQHELISLFGACVAREPLSSVLSYYQREKIHPHQKPVDLIKKLIFTFSSPGDTIFDPFMGSGTTGVAAVQLGRNFIGCEISPEYFAIAEKRIGEAQMQGRLF